MISVLVVDDSALVRALLSDIINNHPGMTLVGAAPDAYIAKDMVNKHSPDVITLDIEMPKVNGLTFLDRLMKARPTPVVMFSSLTKKGADATIAALELGAIDFIPKPTLDIAKNIDAFREQLTDKIQNAAQVKVFKRAPQAQKTVDMNYRGTELVVCIGASTGGTEAIKTVLTQLPASSPAILITQHMPSGFTSSFASRMDRASKMTVTEAKAGERILPGHAYIAPGNQHMEIELSGADYRIRLHQREKRSGHRPSVDVLFESAAKNVGQNALGVLLTGMGKDGADGFQRMKQLGAHTIAQSEKTCVVYGMPKAAIDAGVVDHVMDLNNIGSGIVQWVKKHSVGRRI